MSYFDPAPTPVPEAKSNQGPEEGKNEDTVEGKESEGKTDESKVTPMFT